MGTAMGRLGGWWKRGMGDEAEVQGREGPAGGARGRWLLVQDSAVGVLG